MTDHTPGFASAAKYVATSVKELIRDSSIHGREFVTVVEVMGRDTSLIATHPDFIGEKIRAIIPSDEAVHEKDGKVRFSLKPKKVCVFDGETTERIML